MQKLRKPHRPPAFVSLRWSLISIPSRLAPRTWSMNRCPWSRLVESWVCAARGHQFPWLFSQAELIAWTLEHTEAGVDWQMECKDAMLMPQWFSVFGESGMKHGWSLPQWQGILKTLDHQSWNSRWLEVLAKENERGFHPTTLGLPDRKVKSGWVFPLICGPQTYLHRGFQSMALVIPRRSDLSRLFRIAQCMD